MEKTHHSYQVDIQILGAAKTVTGSKYYLEVGDSRILIDCGVFQGLKNLREENWDDLEIDVPLLDMVLLSFVNAYGFNSNEYDPVLTILLVASYYFRSPLLFFRSIFIAKHLNNLNAKFEIIFMFNIACASFALTYEVISATQYLQLIVAFNAFLLLLYLVAVFVYRVEIR